MTLLANASESARRAGPRRTLSGLLLICAAASAGLGAGLCAGCDGTASVTFATGPIPVELSTAELDFPAELRDGMSVASIPCSGAAECPGSGSVRTQCQGGLCDPDPIVIEVPIGETVDFELLTRDVGEIVREIDEYRIVRVAYEVELNTLTTEVSEVEVFWGPEGTVAIDPVMGVHRLGTVEALPAGATRSGEMLLDSEGSAALSDFLVHIGSRIRFLARTSVDLDPGDEFPEGSVRLTVNLTVRAIGRIGS